MYAGGLYAFAYKKKRIDFKPCHLRVAGLFLYPKICRLIQWTTKGLVDFIRRSFFVVPKEQTDEFIPIQRGCFTLSVIFDFEPNNSINQKFGG